MAKPRTSDCTLLLSFGCIIAACAGQMLTSGSSQQLSAAQTCAANLACSVNYSDTFQTKLDNVSHYVELQVAMLRFMITGNLQPLQQRLDALETNQSSRMTAVNAALKNLGVELYQDRDSINNLTSGLFTLNGDVHQENLQRHQDINKLVLDVNDAKHQIASLQNTVQALISSGNVSMATGPTLNTGSSNLQSCIDKDRVIADLQNNLTYYMNAYTTSQKATENIRALENFLQTQVVELKRNVSRAEAESGIKDKVIVNLQHQIQALQANPAAVTAPGSCVGELGMRNGQIPGSAIVASESQPGHGPELARLDNGQGWYTADKEHSHDFLQIDTGSLHYLTKVATQGAPCCDVMVTNYTLQYSNDGQTWQEYKQNCNNVYFSGNSDASTVVEHVLPEPVAARYIRFRVENFRKDGQSNYVGMRAELYGCPASTS